MATIYQSIEILSKEKGIEPRIVLDAVKDAMLVAARKHYRMEGELEAELDEAAGVINVFALKKVVASVEDPDNEISLQQAAAVDPAATIDSVVRIPLDTEKLGRIAAQTAKQVILQKVREAERETVYAEYSDRVGDLVNCVVKRVEGMDLLVDMGKTEARLPKREQSRAENFSVGDRIRCVIKSVEKVGKNAGVIVSRAAPDFVMRLFEQEVPEIYDGTVVIEGCAREAGERTKIAVSSRDRDVDSVGACVGMKGMRVQSIIRELRGEKIDIIQYSDDPITFATNALSPAKISRIAIVNADEQHMEVIVDDSQLSLAIGRKGQNVRLAAKLLGWRIDIKSEEEKRQEVESEMASLVVPGAPVSVLGDYGLSEKMVQKLVDAGIGTVEQLGSMTPEQLEEIPGIGPKMVEKIQAAVIAHYEQYETAMDEQAVPAEGAEPVEEAPVQVPAEGTPSEITEATGETEEPPLAEVEGSTGDTEVPETIISDETGESVSALGAETEAEGAGGKVQSPAETSEPVNAAVDVTETPEPSLPGTETPPEGVPAPATTVPGELEPPESDRIKDSGKIV